MEEKRLQALKEYKILDSKEETSFDNLAKLAAYLCEAEFAQINFIDSERQWTKAWHNIDVKEIPRDYGFCNYTIQNDRYMIVPDTVKDARFAEKDFVINEPKIRFYAGVNIKSYNGYNIGTICVLGRQNKELEPIKLKGLKTLAAEVEARLELMRSREQIRLKNIYLQNSTDLMLQIDPSDFTVVDLNKEVGKYFSYDESQIIGKKINKLGFKEEDIQHLQKWVHEREREKFSRVIRFSGSERELFFQVDASFKNNSIFVTARDITKNQETVIELKKNLEYQEAISKIALNFNTEGALDEKMNRSLEDLCTTADVSRAYIFLNSNDGKNCRNVYEWHSEGVEAHIDKLQIISYNEDIPGWKEKLIENNQIISSDLADFENPVQQFLEEQGIKAIMAFPIYRDSEFIGFIGFDEERKQRRWTESDINLIKTASRIISNAYKEQVLLEKISSSEQRLRRFIKQAPVAIAMLDTKMNYLERSGAWVSEFGEKATNLENEWKKFENCEKWLVPLKKVVNGEDHTTEVIKTEDEAGNNAWYITKMLPWYDAEGEVKGSILYTSNVTKQHDNQVMIKNSLREKELLLKEIHHRVKNNLAVISAFLQMEKLAIPDEKADSILMKSIGRIQVMAVIYELLLKHDSFSRINIGEMITNLIKKLKSDIQEFEDLSVDTDAVDIEVTINKANPLALLLYELISIVVENNAEDVKRNKINITTKLNGEHIDVKLWWKSELKKNYSRTSKESLDDTIIKLLAKQLNTELKYSDKNGAIWEFSFEKSYSKGTGSSLTEKEEIEFSMF